MLRSLDRRRQDLRSAARAMPRRDELFAEQRRRLDATGARLAPALVRTTRASEGRLATAHARLLRFSPLAQLTRARTRLDAVGRRPQDNLTRFIAGRRELLEQRGRRLLAARDSLVRAERIRIAQRHSQSQNAAQRLIGGLRRQLERKRASLEGLCALFDSLNYKAVLERGFALVRDADGQPLRRAATVGPGQPLAVEFADGSVRVVAEGTGAVRPKRPRPALAAQQGSLFEG
jgi:exodeoxyribonuclease VII large subunit